MPTLTTEAYMTSYSYDSCGDIRTYERARVLEGVTGGRSRAISIATNIAALARDLESLATYPSVYTAEEMGQAFDAMLNETDLIRELIAKGKAAVRDIEQSEEAIRGL